ncbi:splicing factor SF2 [Cardiosporidium cionae]|uniref:Splicing factor SF2 n=1 Tax=Cardiosporidium cionae TaxID=476202 RepID=A0ABQ7J8D9_9APIC|nr:splicing factor SF2 [Cardiosporidium cionae]|eukprot:KAF8820258.1 splicing factor SF2 [Cardiosporidium cionae]
MSYGRGRFNRSPSCIYVGNLPDDVKEKEIEDIFFKFGRVRDIDVKRGRTTNGTAYAFVEFENIRDAEDAVERRDGYMFSHNRLRVEFTGERRPKRKGETSSSGPPQRTDFRVIVSNLPVACRWQHLKDHMRSAGDVGYANIEMGKGIVEYLKYDDMAYALENLDRSELSAYDASSVIKVRRDDDRGGNSRDYGYYKKHSRSRSASRSRERRPHDGGRRINRSPPVMDRHRKRDSRSPAYDRDENGHRSRSHSSANSRYSYDYNRTRRSHDRGLPEDGKDSYRKRVSEEKELHDSRENSRSPRERTPEDDDTRMREEASPVEEIAA